LEYNVEEHQQFMDFKADYDSVRREEFYSHATVKDNRIISE
jgi:hypothetical protein